VSFVLDDCSLREVENSSEGITDSVCDGCVVGRPVPDGEDVFVEPHRDHGPANLLTNHELLAKHGHQQVLPATLRQTFAEPHYPLATEPIRLVLPHGFDAVFENVEVGVRRQFRRPHQVIVNVPELLTAGEGGDQFQVLIKRILSLLAAGDFATVPQAIRRLKAMVSRRNHDIFGLNLFLTDPPFLVAVTGQRFELVR